MQQDYSIPFHRRTYQRFVLDASATLVINENIEEPSILTDLCPRGTGVVTRYALKEDEKLAIIIKVPSLFDSPVYKRAKVVWCRKLDRNLWRGGLDFGEDNKIVLSSSLFKIK